jgi:uncharacterized protein (TIGR02246 family)
MSTTATADTTGPMTMVSSRFAGLEQAWNRADGAAFGEGFTSQADFVDIRGDHHTGRLAVANGHQALFDSIYRHSTIVYEVESAQRVAAGLVIAIASATLAVAGGPLQGTHRSRMTAVLVEQDGGWLIRAFHNTLVEERG